MLPTIICVVIRSASSPDDGGLARDVVLSEYGLYGSYKIFDKR
jgi:hypothetical protein